MRKSSIWQRSMSTSRDRLVGGVPLYYWFSDQKPGDTTGQRVGSIWFVVSPAGDKITAGESPAGANRAPGAGGGAGAAGGATAATPEPTPAATTAPASAGGGYGY
jgi:hypothetical protein